MIEMFGNICGPLYVNDELTPLEIAQKIPETDESLKSDSLNINEEFALFYSVIKNFSSLDPRLIDRTWIMAFRLTSSYKEQLREIFNVLNDSIANMSLNESQNASLKSQSQDNRANLFESVQEKTRFNHALKMVIFINCSFIHCFEDALASQNHRQNFNESISETATPGPKKRKKQRVAVSDNEISFKEYDRYKERIMRDLLQLVSMPLNKVAESQAEAREIVGQILKVSYKMIENSAMNNMSKQKELLDINFSLIGIGIERYNQSLSFCLKFIQLLQYREQLAPLLADLVEFVVTKHDQRLLIGEILRELDRIDIGDLSRDSSCHRAVSTFLISLSEKCPRDFIPSLNHTFEYLSQDSYMMRNASLSVMGNMIIRILHAEGEDKSLRDELLDALLEHIRDTVGYTRSRALAVWSTLCENQCIPLTYIVPVTSAAVARLKDKSCLVRKNAVRFVINILSRNPYAARLPLNTFLETYEIEKATLEKLQEVEKERIANDGELLETLSQNSQADETINDETDPERIHPSLKIKNIALSDESAVVTQQRKVTFLENAIEFTRQIHRAIPLTTEMLTSRNITDIQEAIDFFVHCHEFGIDEALVGFKRMILLVNNQENSVRDAVTLAYQRIFFESSRYEGKPNKESLVVANFISFLREASIGESISLEKLISKFLESGHFTKDMAQELMARFTGRKPNCTMEDSINSIQLIGMMASSQPKVINQNFEVCVDHGLSSKGLSEQESRLVRETCIAMRKALPRKIEDRRKLLRLSRDDKIFFRLQEILVESLVSLDSVHWFSMCDQAIRVIFDLAETPHLICESIFTQMIDKILKNAAQTSGTYLSQDTNTRNESPDFVVQPPSIQTTGSQQTNSAEPVQPVALARFIHFLGDVALDLAVHLELNILLELKTRNSNSDQTVNNISAHNISISNRRRSRRYGDANKSMDEQNLEEEIGLGGAEAEDFEMEFVGGICDEEIVCGKNLLAKLSRIIIEVVADPFRYPNPELKQASSLALAKFMMVSAKYCNDHLRLLFTVLEKTEDPDIKINLLIAISDLCVRFPNQLDGWNGKIFDCLQSDNMSVRAAALKIVSRLVLCDILKAKEQISTIANLIVDSNEEISSFSKHFFLELSKKQNAIYNVLPDIISRLSDPKTGIDIENFKVVMKFVLELVDKSQHIDRLVDKLCSRFMDTDNERLWHDLAFCLSQLKYTDRSIAKLLDRFDCYKDKLCIDSVHEYISSIVADYRKTAHLKNEMKQVLDEFESKIGAS